jgi:3',5'-cyclic AMP phosphodiesterase CpdA
MVRFIHITDTHIAADPNFVLYGHKPLDNLRQLVAVINALPYSFDFVLHTGDVADDFSAEAYRRAKRVLDEFARAYLLRGGQPR